MATIPPFQVEDQTDEDFFDKLVDDDDDVGFKPSGSVPNSFDADGSDSDEAKAFANLSIGEEGVSDIAKGEEGNVEVIGALEKKSNSSSGSVIVHGGIESVVEGNIDSLGMESVAEGNIDSLFVKSSNSPGGGVKEVQWTAFGADTGDDGNDFFSELGDSAVGQPQKVEDQFVGSVTEEVKTTYDESVFKSAQYQENVSADVAAVEQSVDGQVQPSVEYWENQYPGWKFDANTEQWYQTDVYDTVGNAQVQGNTAYTDTSQVSEWGVSDVNSQTSYLQHSSQSVFGAVPDSGITESVSHLNQSLHESVTNESVSNWNEVPQESGGSESVSNWDQFSSGNNGYPPHMVFDPQYPGWYYDSIAQEWKSLESYTSPVQSAVQAPYSVQSTVQGHNQQHKNDFGSTPATSHDNLQTHYGDYGQVDNCNPQGINTQNQEFNSVGSFSNNNQQGFNMWQPEKVAQSGATWDSIGNRQFNNNYNSDVSMTNHVKQQQSFEPKETVPFYQNVTQGQNDFRANGSQGFVPTMNFNQPVNQPFIPQNQQMNVSNDYYGNKNQINSLSPQFQTGHQFSQAGRSSAGRPPHALVTFGFGGKLIVMKDDSSLSASSYGTQASVGGTVSVFNLMEVVMEKNNPLSVGVGGSDYFSSLCKRSFSGPLVGGNVSTKELNKWIDEKILCCDTPSRDYKTNEVLKLVLSLLKIACQYYGKLRSPFGTEAALRDNDAPESAVAQLFASVKGNTVEFNNYNALGHCLQKLPSEEQMRANAAEVQRLLVSGKKKEALELATAGQLWGPALVLAAQLGDQYYCEAVKQMALRQLVAGSPLRTLCLLIAGQPADVFSSDSSASSVPGSANMFQQPTEFQHGINSMLDHWEENLAVITANRTKDDELVLVHLGDSLWKNRSDIIAAHICYLVAEANFEPYSDSARMCLIGADHWKCPRTYANPDAIQRTELYEYSKVLGNSQFILLPFQPYKLVYALMLAEVGKVTESLKYCQSVLKSLKTGRAPEVESLRQLVSSFEERLRTHQQGGYSSNLAPAKIVGKLLNLFDSTAHRVVGGLPPPIPSTSQSSSQINEQYYQNMAPRVSTSQSTMAMSSLMPSASMEPISEWTGEGNRMSIHNRSISEPDIGATPRQNDSSKETAAGQGKAGGSRFGRFGFGSQLFQKTVGLVMKPRQDKQAKLGETNKFYYDEKLKRWVEEGVEPPAEEATPPPPPTTAAFQNGMPDYSLKNALKSEGSLSNGSPEYKSPTSSDHSSGIPPIPTASNQFSARGRLGVRSRYVDTFNKGGSNPTNSFQSPAVPSIKPVTSFNSKFFVPSPVSPAEHSPLETSQNLTQETASISQMSSIPSANSSFPSPLPVNGMERYPSNTSVSEMSSVSPVSGSFPSPPSSVSMQRFPSMDNITRKDRAVNGSGLVSSSSRRTASWSGGLNDASTPPNRTGQRRPPPSSFRPNDPSVAQLANSSGAFGEDLDEVEL